MEPSPSSAIRPVESSAARVPAAAIARRAHRRHQMRNTHSPLENLMSRSILGGLLLLAAPPVVTAQQTTASQTPARSTRAPVSATLIRNATIMTVTKGKLENSDILLQNGKIAAIGKNLSAPAGAN